MSDPTETPPPRNRVRFILASALLAAGAAGAMACFEGHWCKCGHLVHKELTRGMTLADGTWPGALLGAAALLAVHGISRLGPLRDERSAGPGPGVRATLAGCVSLLVAALAVLPGLALLTTIYR